MNPAGRPVVLGVDGGGTKTDVVVADLRGDVIAQVRVGGTNHESIGLAAAVSELCRGVHEALDAAHARPDEVVASAFGLAGVDWASDELTLDTAIAEFGLAGRRRVCNDSEVALRAGTTSGFGIVASIGTGAITAGVGRDGRRFRTMSVGWGEPCGAASIAADALHAIAAEHHRTAPASSLTPIVLEALGVPDVPALFEAVSRGRLRPHGRLAPIVFDAALAGDDVAARLVDRSAVAHAAMVVGVADHLDLVADEFELVTSGGVLAAGGPFADRFAGHVREHCPGVRLVPLSRPPVHGAVVVALELANTTGTDTTGNDPTRNT